jgi:succinyl-diaminopimelate desuccinylase
MTGTQKMPSIYTPQSLTRRLVSYNTVNPPGNERECATFIGDLLSAAGFDVGYHEFAPRRTSLVARKIFNADRPPLCFSGHLDTVPLGLSEWACDPFGGDTDGDRIYGRGSSDMKGGVAAMILAGLRVASMSGGSSGIVLVLTAGEENGCEGAAYLAAQGGILGRAGALVVGEPTSNYPILGHKGAFWLEAVATGVTAHGSMPEQGVNAICKAARAIVRLDGFDFETPPHPVLGSPTINVGTITGGININSVPDRAAFTIDIRTVPPQSGNRICRALQAWLGEDITLKMISESPAVASDPEDRWVREVFDVMEPYIAERPVPRGVSYFTDASALTAAFGHPATVILGPGEPGMAHKTDEFCRLSRIEEATAAYTDIARKWCGLF